jgi:hypothetical protein
MREQPGKGNKKPKNTDLRLAKPPPLPAYVTGEFKENKVEKKVGKEQKIATAADEAVANVKKLKEEIHGYLDIIYKHTGWNPSTLGAYLRNPDNFDKKDWEMIQQQKNEFLAEFNIPEEASEKMEYKKTTKETSKKKAKKKPKLSPGQRKGWLPVK